MDKKVSIDKIKDYTAFTVSDDGRVSVGNANPTTGRFEVALQGGDLRSIYNNNSLSCYREGSRIYLEGSIDQDISNINLPSGFHPWGDIEVSYGNCIIDVKSSGTISVSKGGETSSVIDVLTVTFGEDFTTAGNSEPELQIRYNKNSGLGRTLSYDWSSSAYPLLKPDPSTMPTSIPGERTAMQFYAQTDDVNEADDYIVSRNRNVVTIKLIKNGYEWDIGYIGDEDDIDGSGKDYSRSSSIGSGPFSVDGFSYRVK